MFCCFKVGVTGGRVRELVAKEQGPNELVRLAQFNTTTATRGHVHKVRGMIKGGQKVTRRIILLALG